jgi:cell division inhibitor SepF
MGARNYWDRMLVYFGIAEEAYEDEQVREDDSRASRAGRRAASRAVASSDEDEPRARPAARRSAPSRTRPPSQNVAGVGVVPPRTFNDAQQIADQFKVGHPVIVNLQATDPDLAKRIIDFGSGLT